MGRNQFAVLGLMPGATEAEIKKAYRTLARQYHPDKNNHSGAEEKFKRICAAYEFLMEEDNRWTHERDVRHHFECNRKSRKEHDVNSHRYGPNTRKTENKENYRSSFDSDGIFERPNSASGLYSDRKPKYEKQYQRTRTYAFDGPDIPPHDRRNYEKANIFDERNEKQTYAGGNKTKSDDIPGFDTHRNKRNHRHKTDDRSERFIPNFFFDDFFSFFSEPFKTMEEDFGHFFHKRDPFSDMHNGTSYGFGDFDSTFDEMFQDFQMFDMGHRPSSHTFHHTQFGDGTGDFKRPFGHPKAEFDYRQKRRPTRQQSSFRYRRDPFRETL